ncbi:uncharacterized protein RAG0_09097 [Rhynchosporium agropyri]|uniref:Uncharacterized protein n=1 Tax=Rhynchosporium agropyri TaxID=914238 RepID=A0A1E1KTV8_9HELO|nr:uncharacterized protein RAG0_09097 [Rhynchosporium agropyri]
MSSSKKAEDGSSEQKMIVDTLVARINSTTSEIMTKVRVAILLDYKALLFRWQFDVHRMGLQSVVPDETSPALEIIFRGMFNVDLRMPEFKLDVEEWRSWITEQLRHTFFNEYTHALMTVLENWPVLPVTQTYNWPIPWLKGGPNEIPHDGAIHIAVPDLTASLV